MINITCIALPTQTTMADEKKGSQRYQNSTLTSQITQGNSRASYLNMRWNVLGHGRDPYNR